MLNLVELAIVVLARHQLYGRRKKSEKLKMEVEGTPYSSSSKSAFFSIMIYT
jgi:hypothetical protein